MEQRDGTPGVNPGFDTTAKFKPDSYGTSPGMRMRAEPPALPHPE